MKRQLIILLALYCMVVPAAQAEELTAEFTVAVHAEQWDTLRNGEALLKQPELGDLVQRWMQASGSMIELRYPGGEEGEIWVHELIDWMVALGVPSAAMQSLPGSGSGDTIYMVLISGRN